MSKTFITCAVTGAGDGYKRNPHVPITPDDIAISALAAAEAGAAIIHLHVRDPETGEGSRDDDLYEKVVDRIRNRNKVVIINLTAGMGGDAVFGNEAPIPLQANSDLVGPTQRLSHIDKLRPNICTLDCGSYNVGDGNLVYISTSEYIQKGAEKIRQLGVRPELEVFELGHLRFSLELLSQGVFEKPAMVQFCLGVPYGAPADTGTMKAMADMVRDQDIIWSAFRVGRDQLRMVAQAVLLGGNVRVGLEDNLYLKRGVPARNEQLVSKASDIIETLGGQVMSAVETRELLGLNSHS